MYKILLIFMVLFLSGCNIQDIINPNRDLREKELLIKEKEIAALEKKIEMESKKNIEEFKLNKEIELEKLKTNSETQKLEIEKNYAKELELKKIELLFAQKSGDFEITKYIIALVALFLLIIAGGVYVFVQNRRKDKLEAYKDNFTKYMAQKENESRIKIAEKILDTISTGNLSKEQQIKLIETLNGQACNTNYEQNTIINDEIEDVKLIKN